VVAEQSQKKKTIIFGNKEICPQSKVSSG